MIRRLNMERLQNTLLAFFQATEFIGGKSLVSRLLSLFTPEEDAEKEGEEL
jgi:hypothetical protein